MLILQENIDVCMPPKNNRSRFFSLENTAALKIQHEWAAQNARAENKQFKIS